MKILLLAMVLLLSALAQGASPKLAKIEGVEGAKTVLLQHGISLRDAAVGDWVELGERIRTDDKTTVTITYSDGSHLTILPNTDLEVEKPQSSVQGNLLRSGLVRGEVQKVKLPEGAKAPVKFAIRTKVATMGVRGTEFVAIYNAASELSQFNTLSGTVEVGSTPAQMMSGQGVPIGSGQFVTATQSGLSAVGTFNASSFVSGLSSLAAAMGSGASAVSTANSAASATRAADLLLSAGSGNSSESRPPPSPPPAPKSPQAPPPPPLTPAMAEQKAAEIEQEKPHMHLLGFSVGAFMGRNPDPAVSTGISYYHSLEVAWTPTIPLPVLSFLYVRGSVGVTLFEDYSLNNAFLVNEYQVFVGTTLLSPLYAEVGGGEQIWRNEDLDSGILSANAGLILSANGKLNRVYAGVSKFFKGVQPLEYHVAVGFQLF